VGLADHKPTLWSQWLSHRAAPVLRVSRNWHAPSAFPSGWLITDETIPVFAAVTGDCDTLPSNPL